MRQGLLFFMAALLVGLTMSAFGADSPFEKWTFSVHGVELWQGRQTFVMRAIETPNLIQLAKSPVELGQALNRVAQTGANTVCFELHGLSADGTTLSDGVAKTVAAMMEQVNWRRMGAMCRVFGPDAPKDAAYRKAAICTAANALKAEPRVVYWIDGPDAAELAVEFHKLAPKLVTAVSQGGAIDVVTDVNAKPGAKPVLLAGAIPPAETRETVHFVIPGDEANCAKLDAALANPAESKPWNPDNTILSEQERADGFVALFDGKSLDGWWIIGKKKDGFVVRDGAIEWNGLGGAGLYTRDRYDNFVLRVEWKIKQGGNSGIYLHAPRTGRQSKIGMEFQLMGDAGVPCKSDTTGAVYDVVAPLVNAGKPAGEWNTLEITWNGPQIKAVLNGQVVQDTNFDQTDELKPRIRRGFIGLQDHGCYVAFRNISIKRL